MIIQGYLPWWARWSQWFGALVAAIVSGTQRDDEAQLVAAAMQRGRAGREAFDRLVERYSVPVYRQLYRLLRDPGLADDATQETFVKAYLELPKLRDPSKFSSWIRRIATRTAFNQRRDRSTQQGYEAQAGEAEEMFGRSAPGPEAYTGAAESVWLVLGELAYPYREILVLRYLEELTVDEIAEHLDLGRSAAKMRLKRARDAFRFSYEKNVAAPS